MKGDVNNPVLVRTRRGDLIENYHRGAYVVIDTDGDILAAAGNYQAVMYARSSLKPINVLAMLVSGAADTYAVSDQEIALACASHSGDDSHVTLVGAWLERLGLSVQDLECGIHAPMGKSANKALRASGQTPTALHNACSGKHAGFMTLAKHMGYPIKGYSHAGSPTQEMVMSVAAEILGIDKDTTPLGVDGCCIPMMGMPMIALAKGMARLANSADLRDDLRQACERVNHAVQLYPELVAGTGRFCTDVISLTAGRVLVKMGADGVFTGWIPSKKWGIALKIDDGNLKAAEAAMADLLKRLKLLPQDNLLDPWINQPLHTWTRDVVGQFESGLV
ncbi:MAG: asparaginase [Candidatus Paracaedibacteraceae bacterium]|nr:asparaginase [Candidatus Paracaedibacteraceae bacterium]